MKNGLKLTLTEFKKIITENICNRKNKAVPLHAGNENTHAGLLASGMKSACDLNQNN